MRCFRVAIVLVLIHLMTPTAFPQPLTTSFTVQGELAQSGLPATGPVDLRFRLYDSLNGPGQIGSSLATTGIALSGGRFTVILDFGSVAFAGQRRWLEIDVSAAGAGVYTTLAPRQELTAAPNATFAATAGQATNATTLNGQGASFYQNAANLSTGTIPDARLATTVARTNIAQTFTGAMTFSNAGNAFTGSGAGLSGVNAAQLNGQAAAFYQNATNLATGTLNDARLSTNIPRLNLIQTFTGQQTFSVQPVFSSASVPFLVSSSTLVANLNADLLDGLSAAAFAPVSHTHSAGQITSGTLGDGLLSANVALLGGLQTFVGAKTFSAAPAFTSVGAPFTVSSGTVVTNLNADLLDGLSAGAFGQIAGTQAWSGANTFSNAGNSFNGSFTGAGSGLTSLNATNIASGALADARLSTNVALLGSAQTFSGSKTFSTAPAFSAPSGAPFTVTSPTKVASLNADLLDGLDSTNFFRAGNAINLTTTSAGASSILATNIDVTMLDSSALRGDVIGTTGMNAIGVIGYKGPSGAIHTMIGGGAGVVGYADSGVAVAGVLFGTGAGTGVYGYAETANAFAGLFQGKVGVNGTFDVNFPNKSVQFRLDGGLVPGINLTGTGGNLGVLRLRNALEMWPNDAGTVAARLDVRDTTGAARVVLDGGNGSVVATGSLDVDEWGQNNGTFGTGVLRLGGGGSGEGIASNRTSDANGNRYGLDFYTGGGQKRMSITVDGKVGIGTTNPSGLFQVGTGTDAAVSIPPGLAMGSVPYTSPNTPDIPKQTFAAPDSLAVASIEVYVSNGAAAARATSLVISGPGVNTLSNIVNLPPTGGSPITLTFSSFATTPVLIAGGTYTISFVGGPTDGLVRTYFRTDNPYAGGAASGLGIPAGADLVCTVRLGGASFAPGLTVTADGKVGIRSTAPSAPLTVGGDAIVVGNLSKGGGSFKIDHPLDPANKFLYHSFVESPDMMNIYNGNVVTDAAGYATITLPEWFMALNRDYRYQLTVVDEDDADDVFLWAKVVRKIGGERPNQFTIRSSRGGVEVSWQVTGIRQDAFANANRIPTEVEKSPTDKGRYLHPDSFGLPAERGIFAGKPIADTAQPASSKEGYR